MKNAVAYLLWACRYPFFAVIRAYDAADILENLLVAVLHSLVHEAAHGEYQSCGGAAIDPSAEGQHEASLTGSAEVVPKPACRSEGYFFFWSMVMDGLNRRWKDGGIEVYIRS